MTLFTSTALYFIYRQYIEPWHNIMLGYVHIIVIIKSFTRPRDSLNPDHRSTNLEMIELFKFLDKDVNRSWIKHKNKDPQIKKLSVGLFGFWDCLKINRNRTEGWVDCEQSNRATYMKASQNAVFFGCKPLQICLGNAPRKDSRTPEKLFCPPYPASTHLLKRQPDRQPRCPPLFGELTIYLRKVMGNHTYIIIFVKHFFIN